MEREGEEKYRVFKLEVKAMPYIMLEKGKLLFLSGEWKDSKNGKIYPLEFKRYQIEHYLSTQSSITVQVKDLFKSFVKMSETLEPDHLRQVYESLKENDPKMFKVLKESIAEAKNEMFNDY